MIQVFKAVTVAAMLAVIVFAFSYEFSTIEQTQKFVEEISASPGGRLEPFPQFKSNPKVKAIYTGDPFAGDTITVDAEPESISQTLQYGPDNLSLLNVEQGQALIRMPDNAVYQVKAGDQLWGGKVRIVSIEPDQVTIKYASGGSDTIEVLPYTSNK